MNNVTIPAMDGFGLAATVFRGGDQCIIISAATAVPRQFYRAFAQFLCDERGYTVVTYDYRGIGGSKPDSLRGFEARMRDWGLRDMDGVIEWVSAEFNPTRLALIGHSVGGQVAGMLLNANRVDALVTMSSQSGYWGLQGGSEKWKTLIWMHTLFPLLPRIVGYLPWSWFGSAEDLPKGVALEWGRWCRDRDYLLGDPTLPRDRYFDFMAPVLAYSFDDDDWGTAKSVDAMMFAYPSVQRRHIVPSEYGLEKLGHFGYFRPKSRVLWEDSADWLASKLAIDN